jgi:uncharacterized membrane protein YesL
MLSKVTQTPDDKDFHHEIFKRSWGYKNMFAKIIAALTGILTIGLILYVGVYLFTHMPK